MSIVNTSVIPTCRYEHGRLVKVEVEQAEAAKGLQPRFGWVCVDNITYQFVGRLYTCPTCGYTEFFDDEPLVTANNYQAPSI